MTHSRYASEARQMSLEMAEWVPEEYVMIEEQRCLAVYQNQTIVGWITISVEVAGY